MPHLDDISGWITEKLPALLAEHKVPGAAIGVYANGEVFDFASGVLSHATGVEATADSVFQVGSITKTWTATLIMQLADEGLLDLAPGVVGGDRRVEVPADAINQGFVLGNKVMVGSVNASPADFARGVEDLVQATAFHPGWLEQLLTTPVRGLEGYEQMLRELTENADAIKVYVDVAGDGGPGPGATVSADVRQ